ncbi:TPA: CopG family transcriptional regulator [Escherichia coli]|jgi:hypothetical protein|uniref:CopG family transcriptional regulator n=1 Tax=Pantoea sp. CCBC3-3-1 TaxID=2490851 RepID=UPI0011BE76F9|nr:CopG family transcriptional regulator [Pantoea sp. CCBC3-3-1]MCN3068983.1 CopG family transcriptional regulator [Escherichia coli]HBW0966171.1 CopG family transcriptional regulator [Klebsiella pneumoniae]HDT5032186.1 CopG family transcriptional regulator [Escherichia coli]
MTLKLNRPKLPETEGAATNADTARFISGANRRPSSGKGRLVNFRLSDGFESILEAEAVRTGQNKTTVLKAALAAFDNMDEAEKNRWILESAKIS